MKGFIVVAVLLAWIAMFEACQDTSPVCHQADCRKTIMQRICCKTCSGPNPPTGGPPIFTTAPKTCGKQIVSSSRIVGGSVAKSGSWPWQVLMFYKGYQSCGGTIISPRHIATAAHCVPTLARAEHFIVRVGEHDVNVRNEGYEVDHKVSAIFLKPGYSGITRDKDLAIFKLDQPIQFNSHVQPACLPFDDVAVGKECVVVGWGQESNKGNIHTVLKQATLPIVDNESCRKFNGRITTSNMLCAGKPSSSGDSVCHGDTGGGLVCRSRNDRWILHGVLSYGHDTCAASKLYSVFTRVKNFRSWIEEIMRK